MFKISKNPTFTHTVPVQVPVDGGTEEQSLKVTYRVLGLKKLEQIEPGFDADKQRLYCDAIVEGFDDLVNDEGKPVPCTADMKEQLLDKPYVRTAVMSAYQQAMSGAKSKN